MVDWIPEEAFATCLEYAPQACVELVVVSDGGILLARRTNEPAAGEWFWPGSRLRKGEALADAVHRIADQELGLEVRIHEQLGAAAHHWDVTSVPGVDSRHTINVVYLVEPIRDLDVTLDDQHDDWRLVREQEAPFHSYVETYVERWDLFARTD